MKTTQEKGASLEQGIKILSFLQGMLRDEIQSGIESGFFSSVLQTKDLVAMRDRGEMAKVLACWKLIRQLKPDLEGISITVPHTPHRHSNIVGRPFQLRCWNGGHGYVLNGHVDSGSAEGILLLETFIPEQLKDCDCCYPDQLRNAGVEVPPGFSARKEVKENGGEMYDLITFARMT